MPTRLDDATIRVRLLVDDETERRGRRRSFDDKRGEQRSRRPSIDPERAKKRIAKEKDRISNERRQRLLNEARQIRGFAVSPFAAGAGAAKAAVLRPGAVKTGVAFAAKGFAVAKSVQLLLPLVTASVLETIDGLLAKATASLPFDINLKGPGDSGLEFTETISDFVTKLFGELSGFLKASGRTLDEAAARSRLSRAAGVDPTLRQLTIGPAGAFGDLQKIESQKDSFEAIRNGRFRKLFVQQQTEALLRATLKAFGG